ncbi:hypothetical protein AKO1_011753 [Acrasis kona]|uniref:DOCKER domain-containing protein n=1 Tax=Acrasis kona TaxID=1008807 RepID=A0AAW2Z9R6_9EUKA
MYTNLEKRGARGQQQSSLMNNQKSSVRGGASGAKKNVRDFRMNRMAGAGGTFNGSITSCSMMSVASGASVASGSDSNHSLRRGELRVVDEQMVKNMVMWEGILNTQVSLIGLELLLDFSLELDSIKSNPQLIEKIFSIIQVLFSTNQSETILIGTFHVLKILIRQFSTVIYSNESNFMEQFCTDLLRMCISQFEKVRMEAATMLYHVIKVNYLTLNHFTRTKIQLTIALSGLTAKINPDHVHLLRNAFQMIVNYSQEDLTLHNIVKNAKTKLFSIQKNSDSNDLDFASQVKQLVGRLNETLLDTIKIREADKSDDENYSELYYRIANGYKHAPELSIAWFGNLAQEHYDKERFVESAQCHVYCAALVYHYLLLKKDSFAMNQGIQYQYLLNVSTHLKSESFHELKALFMESTSTPDFQSHSFTPKGFVEYVSKAIRDFDLDLHYEYSIQLWKLLIGYYEFKKDYEKLQSAHDEISKLYCNIHKNYCKQTTRLFGSYYRVAFFGAKVPVDLRNKYMVYKMPKVYRLSELVEYFKGSFAIKYGGEDCIKIISDAAVISESDVENAEIVKIMITALRIQNQNQCAQFEQFVNLNEFVFETPFTKSGKTHGALNEQYKRRTTIRVQHPFPNMLTRQLVVSSTHVEMSPIQNSIEIVESSIEKLDQQSSVIPPDVNSLQMVLSGTLIPQVNEGIPSLVNLFLADEKLEGNEELNLMKIRMVEFLKSAGKCLEISRKNCRPNQLPLHEKFEEGFVILYNLFSKYLNVSEVSVYLKRKGVSFQEE